MRKNLVSGISSIKLFGIFFCLVTNEVNSFVSLSISEVEVIGRTFSMQKIFCSILM